MDLVLAQRVASQKSRQACFHQRPLNPLHPLGSQWVTGIPLLRFGVKPRESVIREAGERARAMVGK